MADVKSYLSAHAGGPHGLIYMLEMTDGRFALMCPGEKQDEGCIVSPAFAAAFKAEFCGDAERDDVILRWAQ